MTLVVAAEVEGGVLLASERIEGGFDYTEIRGPKIDRMHGPRSSSAGPDEPKFEIGIGFSGSGRVAQVITRLELPPRDDDTIQEWMTRFCDTIQSRCTDLGLIAEDDDPDDEPTLRGYTAMVVGAEGHAFYIGRGLQWTEPVHGWTATGGARETFGGAYTVYRDQGLTPADAVRAAWTIAQQYHRVGDLADTLLIHA